MIQESGTILGYSDKSVDEFKLSIDAKIELFSVGFFGVFVYDRLDGLSVGGLTCIWLKW